MLVPHQHRRDHARAGLGHVLRLLARAGLVLPDGGGGAYRLHGHLHLDGSRHAGVRDPPHQPRPSLREGQCGGPAPSGERGGGGRLLRRERVAPGGRRCPKRRYPRHPPRSPRSTDAGDPHRARPAGGAGLRPAGRALGGTRHESDRGGRPGATQYRPDGQCAGRPPARHLLPRARADRPARRQCAARARCRHRPARVEPLWLGAAAVPGHAGRRRHVRVRHPGRGRALLHLSHHPRLHPRGRGPAQPAGGGARPAQPHHGEVRGGAAHGSGPPLVHLPAHHPRAYGHDHGRVRADGGDRAEARGAAHRDSARGLGARALVRRDGPALGEPVAQYPVARCRRCCTRASDCWKPPISRWAAAPTGPSR